jgi:NADPH:quinone reductase-like Zn-dependent oxidoreductase
MTPEKVAAGLELRSLARPDATLEISLVEAPVARPGPDEVLIRVEATPINPRTWGSFSQASTWVQLVSPGRRRAPSSPLP